MECLNLITMTKKELIQVAKKSIIPHSNKNKSQLIESILNEPERIKQMIIRDEKKFKKDYEIMVSSANERQNKLNEDRPNEYKEPNLFTYSENNQAKQRQLKKEQDKYDMRNYGLSNKELRKFKEDARDYINVLKKRIPDFIKSNTFINIRNTYQEILNNNNESNESNNNKRNSQNLLIQLSTLIKNNKIDKNEKVKKIAKKAVIDKPIINKKPPAKKPLTKPKKPKKEIEESKNDDEDEAPIITKKPTMSMFDNDFNRYKVAMDRYNKITYELTNNEEKKLKSKLTKLINTIKKNNPITYRKSRYNEVVQQLLRDYENIEKGNEQNQKKQILINLVNGVSKFNKKDLNITKKDIETFLSAY